MILFKEGIRWGNNTTDGGYFIFDFKNDKAGEDFILLKAYPFNNRISTFKGLKIYTAFRFEFRDQGERKEYIDDNITIGDAINIMRRNLKYDTDYSKNKSFIKMVDMSIDRFSKLVDLNSFDLIIPAPSTSKLNDFILDRFKKKIQDKNVIKKKVFLKNSINRLGYYAKEYNKLSSKGKKMFKSSMESILKKIKDGSNVEYEIKMVPAGMRSLIHNFIDISDKNTINVKKRLQGGKILIIDDTIGSGSTFMEILRNIEPYKPEDIYLYSFIKDY